MYIQMFEERIRKHKWRNAFLMRRTEVEEEGAWEKKKVAEEEEEEEVEGSEDEDRKAEGKSSQGGLLCFLHDGWQCCLNELN